MFIRFTHFHVGHSNFTDKKGVVHVGKGRLAGTLATTELPNGELAVAVSRCAKTDAPVRAHGRVRAKARLERFVRSLDASETRTTQSKLLADEVRKFLVFRTTRENFLRVVIEGQLFQKLAALNDSDFREHERLIDTLRDIVL